VQVCNHVQKRETHLQESESTKPFQKGIHKTISNTRYEYGEIQQKSKGRQRQTAFFHFVLQFALLQGVPCQFESSPVKLVSKNTL
jgi:hypothetical protein